jgi:hypothetical protein
VSGEHVWTVIIVCWVLYIGWSEYQSDFFGPALILLGLTLVVSKLHRARKRKHRRNTTSSSGSNGSGTQDNTDNGGNSDGDGGGNGGGGD